MVQCVYMVVNCGRLSIPLLNSSLSHDVKLYGIYLTFRISDIVICCLILFPSSMKYVNVRYDLAYPVLSAALL